MNSIHVLSEEVISTIAAGQVIDSPASVVKELVDNALDAGATHITIELQKGGVQRITVTDDGKGMTEEELAVCFLPHTTSKISALPDLQTIQTLGFRGEGLASMVIAADVTVASRLKENSVGAQIAIRNGSASPIAPLGMPHGTRVSVAHIFKNMPARKKFLKKEQTELRAIITLVQTYSLAYPKVMFIVSNNKQVIFNTQHKNVLKRIAEITLLDEQQLLPLQLEGEYVQVAGYIGTPQLAGRKITNQYIFINNRAVSYPEIQKVVKESYKTLLEPYAQPVFFLKITVPGHMIDINIDPKKEKIHIYHLKEVVNTLYTGITDLFATTDIHYSIGSNAMNIADSGMEAYTAHSLRKKIKPWSLKNIEKNTEIAQFYNTYLITQIGDELIMVDQHAAHERILYEQFLAEFEDQKKTQEIITLQKPQVIQYTAAQMALIQEYSDRLSAHGFTLEIDQENATVTVSKVPALFQTRELQSFLLELCEDWQTLLPSEKPDLVSHKTIAYLACRTAIKAGEVLTNEERRSLFEKLAETKTQYTCPHGRPVQLTISLYELEKMFHRK